MIRLCIGPIGVQNPGFCGARLLRRLDGHEVMFTSITFITSMDDVRGFAGEDPEQAVVEETARRALSRWDERLNHDKVAVELRHHAGSHPAGQAEDSRVGRPAKP